MNKQVWTLRWMHGVLAALVVTAGCAGSNDSLPAETTGNAAADGALSLRVPDPAFFDRVQVNTWNGQYRLAEDGSFQAGFPAEMQVRFAFVSPQDQPDKPLYYGYFFPEQFDSKAMRPFIADGRDMIIDARTTALAMTLFNPLLFDSTVEQRAMVAEEVLTHPQFPVLVQMVEDVKALDKETAIRWETTPDLFMVSGQITIDSLKTIADRLPDPVRELDPQGISYDYDMAYPQNIEEGTVRVYNPKMAYYAAGFRNADDPNWEEEYQIYYVEGKERWLDISIFPPSIEVVPPTERNIPVPPGGAKMLEIYKGFQFDYPFDTLWNKPPARMAMYANAWASWSMMISLAGDISNIVELPLSGLIDHMANVVTEDQEFEDVWLTVQDRDNVAAIDSFYDVFVDVLPALEAEIEEAANAQYHNISGGGGTMSQITTIFEGVWALVAGGGIVNGIIDVTTQVVPFYWDLFTAHSTATYPIFEGGVNPLPDTPTISRVYPNQIVAGRNAVVQGFLFGNDGELMITHADEEGNAVQSPASSIDWDGDAVTFSIPEGINGFPTDTEGIELVYVQVMAGGDGGGFAPASGGTPSNSFEVPLRAAGAEGEGGGGGCSVVPTGAAGNGAAGALVMVLLPLVFWRANRCSRRRPSATL